VRKINLLTKLNLSLNYIYETIVTTYTIEDKLPHAAPMGIRLINNQTAAISPYLNTTTYKNIENSRCAVINFIYDLDIFFQSTFNLSKPKLPLSYFKKASKVDAPRLKTAIAYIEVRVLEIQKNSERSTITGEIVNWEIIANPIFPLNRGYNLVLESIIHATRILAYKNDEEKVRPLEDLIFQYRKLIEKVAPAGKFVDLMNKIQDIIKKK